VTQGEAGHVYNIGTKEERRVIDVASDICRLVGVDPTEVIQFVDDRPFNDQRYFLDEKKLKALGWSEKTTWEVGLRRTMDWYRDNQGFWGDVSGALKPHPRMLVSEQAIGQTASTNGGFEIVAPKVEPRALPRFLIYGRTGWIGGLLGKLCEKQGIPHEYGLGRLEDRQAVEADIQRVNPTHIFNAAGVTGRPNVDWCEIHRVETLRANVIGVLNLCDVAR
jgi:UDP-glucose 4,6-dehydratase